MLIAKLTDDFFLAFATLFSIINPLGLAFVYREMTVWATPSERKRLSNRIALYALCVIVASYFVGTFVLSFFGISLPVLRISGGFVVAAAGWQLLGRKPAEADSKTPAAMDTAPLMQMAFFPLTMPLTTGPGTIAVAIAFGAAKREHDGILFYGAISGFVLAAIAMAGIVLLCYRNADRLARITGTEGTRVVTSLSAFLLLCVGIQIMTNGIIEVAKLAMAGG